MSAPFNARDWLQRWTASGNAAFATTEPKPSVALHFDGENVGELMSELCQAGGVRHLFGPLCTLGEVRDGREADHG